MKLPEKVLNKMIEEGYIRESPGCPVEDMKKFGYYNIQEDASDQNGPLFLPRSVSGGLRYIPLHPEFDRYVFGYVDGCFYPMLLADDNALDSRDVTREGPKRTWVHPNYPFYSIQRCVR